MRTVYKALILMLPLCLNASEGRVEFEGVRDKAETISESKFLNGFQPEEERLLLQQRQAGSEIFENRAQAAVIESTKPTWIVGLKRTGTTFPDQSRSGVIKFTSAAHPQAGDVWSKITTQTSTLLNELKELEGVFFRLSADQKKKYESIVAQYKNLENTPEAAARGNQKVSDFTGITDETMMFLNSLQGRDLRAVGSRILKAARDAKDTIKKASRAEVS